nr:MAG TPA: Primosomal protein 1 [Caudoviricetes sp.]
MAWIESHQELWRHPKTKKLARLLHISIPTAVGHLHGLWYWAMDFAQDGDLSTYDAEDIADAVMWEGDAQEFLDALVESKYADQTEHGVVIHDWFDYAGGLLESKARKREQSRLRVQEYRKRKREAAANAEQHPSDPPPPSEPEEPEEGEKPGKSPPVPYAKIMAAYNEICTSFSKIISMEGERRRAVGARWAKWPSLETFKTVFQKAEASDFMRGCNKQNWVADFDWMMKSSNMQKILEGKYDNGRLNNGTGSKDSGPGHGRQPPGPAPGTSGFKPADGS